MDASLVNRKTLPYIASASAIALIVAGLGRFVRTGPRQTLLTPPGPKALPIIGNLLNIPQEEPWLKYSEWIREYGDVVYIKVFNTSLLFLGSFEAATDLLDRKSTIYSDRLQFVMVNELMGLDSLLPMLPYGDRWRQARKQLHPYVHINAVATYQPLQLAAAQAFARNLLINEATPEGLHSLIRENFAETIVKIVYGINATESAEAKAEFIDIPAQVLNNLNLVGKPDRFLVNYLPILKYIPSWVPGAGFQTIGRETRTLHYRARDTPMKLVCEQMVKGTAPPSMIRSMLEDTDPRDQDTHDLIRDLGEIAYLAGSDTTVATVITFVLAMVRYPDVQRKAQEEIDRVVGRDRLPDFGDQESLPYINAILLETLRWLPAAPQGVAHYTTTDDVYRGYFIPRGTVVMAPAWAFSRDVNTYADPDCFNPERFILKNNDGSIELDRTVRDPRSFAFGFGRRVCPGRHIAEQSLFATIATLLAVTDILPARSDDGVELIPEIRMTTGIVSHPKPFPYTIRARSSKAKQLLTPNW